MIPPILRRSNREVGLAFENHALAFLNGELLMSLAHVGGAGDGGVDLRGWWWLPRGPRPAATTASTVSPPVIPFSRVSPPGLTVKGTPNLRKIRPLRVIAQCKAERARLGPRAVRELEGVMSHLATSGEAAKSVGARQKNTAAMAILLSQSGFSSAAMIHALGSAVPFLLVHLPGGRPDDISDSEKVGRTSSLVEGAWCNPVLGKILNGIELRREILVRAPGQDPDVVRARVGVWYGGQRMERYGPPFP